MPYSMEPKGYSLTGAAVNGRGADGPDGLLETTEGVETCIDIHCAHAKLHYGDAWPKNASSGDSYKLPQGNFTDDFHIFAIDWREGKIEWYVDGKRVQTQTKWSTTGGPFPAPFDQKFHLLLNLSVGGGFVGPVGANTKFPAQYLIDYVRIYQ